MIPLLSTFRPQYNVRIVLTRMTRAFRRYPICRGPLDKSGSDSGHHTTQATISNTWLIICFTIYSNKYKNWSQTTSFSVFIAIFSSLITKHNWRHNRHNHGHRRRKWPPSTPHEALRSAPMLWINTLQPPELADVIFGGVEGVYGPQSAPLFRRWWIATTSECFEGRAHPKQPQKLYPLAQGLLPIHN